MKKSTVIEYFKTPTKAAGELKVTVGAVSQWGEIIPEKQAMRLERITNGALKYDPQLYTKSGRSA